MRLVLAKMMAARPLRGAKDASRGPELVRAAHVNEHHAQSGRSISSSLVCTNSDRA